MHEGRGRLARVRTPRLPSLDAARAARRDRAVGGRSSPARRSATRRHRRSGRRHRTTAVRPLTARALELWRSRRARRRSLRGARCSRRPRCACGRARRRRSAPATLPRARAARSSRPSADPDSPSRSSSPACASARRALASRRAHRSRLGRHLGGAGPRFATIDAALGRRASDAGPTPRRAAGTPSSPSASRAIGPTARSRALVLGAAAGVAEDLVASSPGGSARDRRRRRDAAPCDLVPAELDHLFRRSGAPQHAIDVRPAALLDRREQHAARSLTYSGVTRDGGRWQISQ